MPRFTNGPSFCCVLGYVLFLKNVIVLHHSDYNFLFRHLCQIHTFNNNLNNEEMITSYNCFMIKMLQLSCYIFFMIKISCLYNKQYQINLGKPCYMAKPFRHSKI